MDYNYKGIYQKDIELLCLNKFNDSRKFYEEHKIELKDNITVPMRQIVLDMSDTLYDIDDKMFLDPVRCVSRIYRDTRGNRSKLKYRENMWIFFRRYKNEFPSAPFYYFEFYPDSFGWGLVFWTWRAGDFRTVHEMIIEQPNRFKKALKACEKAGLQFNCRDFYKKEKYPDAPKTLKPYLLAKNFSFSHYDTDMKKLETTNFLEEMKKSFVTAREMYDFMIDAYERMLTQGLIKSGE